MGTKPQASRNSGGLSWHTENINSPAAQRVALWRVISENTGNPLLRRQAASIIREYNIPERNELAFVTGILTYFQNEVKFFREYPEIFASPMRTIEWGIGDCDDKSIGVAAILRTFRIPVRLKVIHFTQKGVRKAHVYPQAWVNNNWLTLETVQRWAPGEDAENKLKARGIKVTSEYIGDTPTKFKGESMAVEDYDYENPIDTVIDTVEVTPALENYDNHSETVDDRVDTIVAQIDDVDTDIPPRPMPLSFRRLIPNATRIYIELNDGRQILFVKGI